jgi:hypothetical protein
LEEHDACSDTQYDVVALVLFSGVTFQLHERAIV